MKKKYPARDKLEAVALELEWLKSAQKAELYRKVLVGATFVLCVVFAVGLMELTANISTIVLGK